MGALAAALFNTASAREETTFTLDAVCAEIVTSAGRIPLQSSDGLFDRAFIAEKGSVRLRVTISALLPGHEVSIAAPNGGELARIGSDAKLRFTPKAAGPLELDLEFTPTLGRGAYTITIRQAGALATLDLWAGKPNPVGQAGPAYVPVRDTEPQSPRVSASPWLGQDFRMAGRQLVP